MDENGRPPGRRVRAWPYALLGGAVAVLLAVGQYWGLQRGDGPVLATIFVGGVVAGVLAERASVGTDVEGAGTDRTPGVVVRASAGAGLVAGLPLFGTLAFGLLSTAGDASVTSSARVGEVALGAVFGGLVLGLAASLGLLGGVVGGWVSRVLGGGGDRRTGREPS